MNLTFVLHHSHTTREPLFQIRNLNIAVDLREGILQAGGQIEIYVTHGFHACFSFTIPIGQGNIKCANSFLLCKIDDRLALLFRIFDGFIGTAKIAK